MTAGSNYTRRTDYVDSMRYRLYKKWHLPAPTIPCHIVDRSIKFIDTKRLSGNSLKHYIVDIVYLN